MKIIDKKSFLPTVCVVYTVLSMSKIVLEAIFQNRFGNYQANFLIMFFLSLITTLVLSQHYRLHKIPLTVVIIGQYLVLVGIVLLLTKILGFYSELHKNAYRDMFLSFTISYIFGAVIYYIQVFLEVKKANEIIMKLKESKK